MKAAFAIVACLFANVHSFTTFSAKRPIRSSLKCSFSENEAMKGKRPEIIIVGGGFGGLNTALNLSKKSWKKSTKPHVTIVDKKDKFVFLPLLYDLAADSISFKGVAPTYKSLLEDTEISFIQGLVSDVDFESNEITVIGSKSSGFNNLVLADDSQASRNFKYDEIILAPGAESVPSTVPGAVEYSWPFYTIEDTYKLQTRLRYLKQSGKDRVKCVVVGGSLCGVEIACTISNYFDRCDVTIITRGNEMLAGADQDNRNAALEKLGRLNIKFLTATSVKNVMPEMVTVETLDATELNFDSDLTVWTAGSKPNSLLSSLDLQLSSYGKVKVNETLKIEGKPNAYCIGDCACIEGANLPSNAQVAMQQSDYLAHNIWAKYESKKPLNFKYSQLGEFIRIGSFDTTASLFSGSIKLRGVPGWITRRATYAIRSPSYYTKNEGLNLIYDAFKVSSNIFEKTTLMLKNK